MRRVSPAIEAEILRLHAAGRSCRATQKLLLLAGHNISAKTVSNVCRRSVGAGDVEIRVGDCREILPTLAADSVQCCLTSPPYWGQRDYGHPDQIGHEPMPEAYVEGLVRVFRELHRVLRADGTLWLNLGDTFQSRSRRRGSSQQPALNSIVDAPWPAAVTNSVSLNGRRGVLKPKDLVGLPWRVAFMLQADGWYLRQSIIWHKPATVPESVRDRPTTAHEYVFLPSKSERYYYDAPAIAEPAVAAGRKPGGLKYRSAEFAGRPHGASLSAAVGETRNRRSVWTIATQPFAGQHSATMPVELARLCIQAGSRVGDLVLDPFGGAGTTALAARTLMRRAMLIELRPSYASLARERVAGA